MFKLMDKKIIAILRKLISLLQKIGVPAPKMGVQNCKSSVSESSGFVGFSFIRYKNLLSDSQQSIERLIIQKIWPTLLQIEK